MPSENNDFFRELVETTDDLVIRLDRAGRFWYVSPSAEKIFGIKPNLCIGRRALSFVHKDDRRSTLESFARWVANKTKSARLENRNVSFTGEVRLMMWTINLNFDQSGALVGVNSIGRDITQMKKAEEELRRREEMWNKLFMASPTWIALATLEEGLFLDFNDAFCKDTGYRKEELLGSTSVGIGLWPDPEERNRVLSLIKEKGGVDKLPIKLRMRNGELRDFLWSSVIVEVQGQPCLLNVLVDVSNLKRTEEQLAKTNKELQKRSNKLAEMNAALKVLLNQREEDKKELESRVWHNIKKMVQPHLNNLKMTKLTSTQLAHLDVAVNRLNEIASAIGERLGYNAYNLSVRELEVAGHIIEGKANKDIAEILNISVHSVESHRFSMRKKLGILGSKINLRTHLLTLSKNVEGKSSNMTRRT